LKRVLLIEPPVTRPLDMLADKVRIGIVPPLGLAYMAAVIEKEAEVKILDCVSTDSSDYEASVRYGLTDADIIDQIACFCPDIVGVSCLTSNKAWDAHNVCRLAKQVNPKVITCMGGTHPTVRYEETLADKNVDLACKGEGEYWLEDVVTDSLVTMPPKPLDEYPYPARHLLDMEKYTLTNSPHSGIKRKPFTSIMTSRGCPARCSFCTIREMWGKECRQRSPENVLGEIEQLITNYGIKELHFEDDNFTFHKERAMAILQGIINHKWDLSLNSPSGLALITLDDELLEKMAEAGYYSISIAIESGDPHVLKDLMHKPVRLEKVKPIVGKARSLGMKVKAFFILGYPGETKESMQRTVDFAGSIGLDWALFFVATPLPGTEMEAVCRKNGWLVNPSLDYMHSFYTANIRTSEFDPDYVLDLKERANRSINFDNNYNVKVGAWERARADFEEVVSLYPHLDFAQEALRRVNEKRDS
jgi:anaerobic magnesium-protoporphyrin IX monomethyl ester cyclase